MSQKKKAVCLFSSAGIGELGIREAGIEIILANELISSRVALYRENFDSRIIEGDIAAHSKEIVDGVRQQLGSGEELFLIYATPPCQGMSSNGLGKLKSEVASGRRSAEDKRNRLIIPTMDIVCSLKPRWLLLENVPGMEKTEIRTSRKAPENIISYVARRLGKEYVGRAEVVACEDYGVPQRRKRLITVFTRDPKGKRLLMAEGTFFSSSMREPVRTLREAIAHLPPLDARPGRNERKDFHPYHYVPVMSELKYSWVEHTVEGDTAFNNQCIAPNCMSQKNSGHQDILVDGKWVSSKEIPIYCSECGSLLPRPYVLNAEGKPRLLKGFHSAYRRMKWDESARTLTQNFIYEASDNKIHPTQNRVLSVYEAMILQTIDRYPYAFTIAGKPVSTARIAEVIGESVPPYLIEKICRRILRISGDALVSDSVNGILEDCT